MRAKIPIALVSGVLSAASWLSGGEPQSQAGKEQQVPPPVVQSPKATIPGVPPRAEPAKPAANDTADPSKMAAPAATITTKPPGSASVNDKTYIIGSEDVLFVLVWGNKELSNQVMVRPDGMVTVGLVGEIIARGKTPEELGQEIADKLKEGGYIRSPQVQVSVHQINSRKFYINGEVNKPGTYNLVVPTRVLEALVNAGGFKDFANKKDIRIVRGDKQLKFNYTKVIKGQNKDENIFLEPGDIIIVK